MERMHALLPQLLDSMSRCYTLSGCHVDTPLINMYEGQLEPSSWVGRGEGVKGV